MRLFVVSCLYVKTMLPNVLDQQNCVGIYDATDHHNAIGQHVEHYRKQFPEHNQTGPIGCADITDRATEFVRLNT